MMALVTLMWFLAVGIAVLFTIRSRDLSFAAHKSRAYQEILAEKGVVQLPGETTKQALLRARREESFRPGPSPEAILEARKASGTMMRTPPPFQTQRATEMPEMRKRMPSRSS